MYRKTDIQQVKKRQKTVTARKKIKLKDIQENSNAELRGQKCHCDRHTEKVV